MIKCSLLNFSNRRRTSFFYNCRSFTLISFYFDLPPFYNLHTPFLTFLPEFPRLSSLLFSSLYNFLFVSAIFFIHQVFKETDIRQRRIIGNSCVIIVSNMMPRPYYFYYNSFMIQNIYPKYLIVTLRSVLFFFNKRISKNVTLKISI